MKRQLPYLVLALVALLLVAAYIAVATDTDPAKTGVLFKAKNGENVTAIEIKNTYGTFDFYQKDGEWLVSDGSGEYHTNADKMNLLTASLLDFSVLRVLETQNPEYGLDSPRAAVSFQTSAGRSGVVLVGNPCANAAENYARAGSVAGALITNSASVAQLTGSLAAYRTNQVFVVDLAAIQSVTYRGPQQPEELTFTLGEDGGWRLTSPFAAGARRLEISEFLAGLTKWSIADYPQADAVGETAETLTLTDAAGATQTIALGKAEGTLRYARIGGKEDVVALYATDIDLSVLTADALLYEAPLYTALDNVRSFSVALAGAQYAFTVDPAAQTAQVNGRYIDYDSLIRIYYRYVLLLADGFDASPAPGAPVAQMTTALADGEPLSLTLYERDETTLFMEYGGGSGFYLEKSRLELLAERLAALQ